MNELLELGGAWGLAAVRVFGVLVVQPHWRRVVGPWWPVVAAALALVLAPVLATGVDAPRAVPDWIVAALLELGLGLAIGLLAALPAHAALGAADVSGRGVGLPAGALAPFSALWLACLVVFSLELELHRPLVSSLAATTGPWPIGAAHAWLAVGSIGPGEIAAAAHAWTLLALTLATPVLLAAAVADLGVRLMTRGPGAAEPVGAALVPWVRTAAALVALGASWSARPEAWAGALG